MRLQSFLLALALAAPWGPPLRADVIRTVAGQEIAGELTAELLRVKTDSGEVEIPKSALLQVRRQGERLEFLLSDNSKVLGSLLEESLRVKVGLLFQVIPADQLDLLMLMPPGFPLGALESAYLPAQLYKGHNVMEFCPIRLELDVSQALRGKEGGRSALGKTRYFSCDSLSITSFELSHDLRRDLARIDFQGALTVLESFDKWARVTVELLAGEHRLAQGQDAPIDAEERKTTAFSIRLNMPRAKFDAALASAEPLHARVTVDVGRNGDVEYLQVWGVRPKGPKYDSTKP